MLWWLLGAALLAGCCIWIVMRQPHKRRNSKVVKLSTARGKAGQPSRQPCSLCKKKAARLSFYASEQGQVIGLCDACKPQAERRGLLPL